MATYLQKRDNIIDAHLSIHDPINIGDLHYWFTGPELTAILRSHLVGTSLAGMAIRTRSKRAKSLVCDALGYPIPKSFPKKQPRFTGQKFDLYVQQATNLQIWNQEIDPERRYVLMMLDKGSVIINVVVINGVDLALLDTTGTLTQKYQARLTITATSTELISHTDTEPVLNVVSTQANIDLSGSSPTEQPELGKLLSISVLFNKLSKLVGATVKHLSFIQERNRGAALHQRVCQALGYKNFHDNGQFPDVRHQLVEVKLQTSPTIDLGLVCPDSEARLDIEQLNGHQIRHCDARYAIFYGRVIDDQVQITHFYLTTGQDFFSRFPPFGGKSVNTKIQLRLPDFFFLTPTAQTNLSAQDGE